MKQQKILALLPFIACSLLVQGCSWMPSSGPERDDISSASQAKNPNIRLIDVTAATVQVLKASEGGASFAQRLGNSTHPPLNQTVGAGDTLEVSVWEAPPALLFGTSALGSPTMTSSSQVTAFPPQMVAADGTIQIPFAGAVPAAGLTLQQIQAGITQRLTGKANQPQALVRLQRNATSDVTVVGEVGQSTKVPLSPKGERLLDAIAAAGGSRQPIEKVSVQITRGNQVVNMPLDRVVKEPSQNIQLAAGDIVTVMYQPKSFTVLGAAGKNAEINFESNGVSLAQALARAGGIQATQGDAQGIFIFRFEDRHTLTTLSGDRPQTAEAKTPVVYRLNLENPASFLNAQEFPMRDKDILYIADAPSVGLQKFLSILSSSVYSVNSIVNLGN
jgi:polysaccharide export outer membrane protein